jgi:hypothetical protein
VAGGADGVVSGTRELDAFARKLKAAGEGGLKRELTRRQEEAMARLRPVIKNRALSSLPRSGGLAALVAGSELAVTTVGDGTQLTMSGSINLAAINAGRLSHPVFGKGPNVTQSVKPGFFDTPAREHERDFAHELDEALEDVKRDIEGHF